MQRKKQLTFCALCVCALVCLLGAAVCTMPSLAQSVACICADSDCDCNMGCDAGCVTDCGAATLVSFADERKIDLNTASKEQLCLLSGVGEAKAGYIIEYRVLVGAFESLQDVANVSGITQQMIEQWGEQAYVRPIG